MTLSRSRWDEAVSHHSAAVHQFLATASAVAPSAWPAPVAPGKWSPGQITAHVTLAYDAMGQELRGTPGMRIRTTWWQRLIFRAVVLPALLRNGTIPGGAKAPRETRPHDVVTDQAAAIEQLRQAAAAFEEDIGKAHAGGGARLTHPYFGRLDTLQAIRLVAVHTEHHTRQLPRSAVD